MSEDIFFESVDHITVGAVGPPGQRTFMLQVRKGVRTVTLIIEKTHALSLAETAEELLTRVGIPEPATSWTSDSMELDESEEPIWRVRQLDIGYEETRDLILLVCREATDDETEPATAQFWITREQLSALSSYGLVVASQGRPLCPFCNLPMDPEGHQCPAMNGHREGYFQRAEGSGEP